MTSIIGYTRVPFNSSASKYFTIAPVKQLYQNKPPNTHHDQQQQQNSSIKNGNGGHDNNKNNSSTRRPTYHRMFSREMSQHGIIELIIDKMKQQQQSDTNRTTNNTQDNETTTVHIKNNSTTQVASPNSSRRRNNYNIFLSIDLSGSHDYDNLSTMKDDASFDNLQRLMDSISRIAQEKTIHFVNILNLLKKLQLQQEQHRFMSCIDKYNQKILVYFPNTISSTSIDQTYEWLKYTVGIDVNKFRYWDLSFVVEEEPHQFVTTATTTDEGQQDNNDDTKKDLFDGESYFNDLHMFIDHVDSLIESNGLFSHHQKNQKKKRTNYMK